MKINLYFPKDWKASDRRPGIVLFFGGGFVSGTPAQFTTKAEYFASRGLVAASAEYRIGNVHHTPPAKCVEDAKSVVRWLRFVGSPWKRRASRTRPPSAARRSSGSGK